MPWPHATPFAAAKSQETGGKLGETSRGKPALAIARCLGSAPGRTGALALALKDARGYRPQGPLLGASRAFAEAA